MSSFVRNVIKLGGGNVAAQVISLVAVPVITRIYSPDAFGAFSFVQSLVLVLYPVSTLRLNSAILLPEDEQTAEGLLLASLLSVIVSAFLLMPLLMIGLYKMAGLDAATETVLWYLVAGVLVHGAVQCYEFWLLRHKRYSPMAWGAVAESVADRLTVIGMGLLHQAGAVWLVLGRVVGAIAHLAVLVRQNDRVGATPGFVRSHLRRLPGIVRRYKNFPLYSTWAFLLANGARELPTVVLAALFNPAVAGLYSLGVRVLGFPILMVGDAVAKVFFRYATSVATDPDRLQEATRQLVRYLMYLILPPMLALILFGPQLFQFVFGEQWIDAGVFARILAMSFLVAFLYRVLSIFFDMFENQAQRLLFDAAQFLGRIGGMILAGLVWGAEAALWALMLSTILVQGAGVVHLLSRIGIRTLQTAALLGITAVNLLPISVVLVFAAIVPITALAQAGIILAGLVLQLAWLVWREPRLAALLRERVT